MKLDLNKYKEIVLDDFFAGRDYKYSKSLKTILLDIYRNDHSLWLSTIY